MRAPLPRPAPLNFAWISFALGIFAVSEAVVIWWIGGEMELPLRLATLALLEFPVVIAVMLSMSLGRLRQRHQEVLEQSRAEARDAAEAKSEFLARTSHELRTPMNAIIGMTDLMLGTEVNAEQREYLRTARASARTLLTLVDDLLDFTQSEGGQLRLGAHPFSLREALGEALRPFGMRAQEKGLELALLVDSGVPDRVQGDSRRLKQVVGKLVSNAVKFTAEGEVFVWVKTQARSADQLTIRLSVTDTGIGIASSRREEIFQPFAERPFPVLVSDGMGLGLALSSELVKRMGGGLDFHSELGQGSEFVVTLPLTVLEEPSGMVRADLGELPILVVDDHVRHRETVCEMLRGWHARPRFAADVETALEELDRSRTSGSPIGALILDADLPGGGASRILEALDEDRSWQSLPCLFLTSRLSSVPVTSRHTVRVPKPLLSNALLDGIEGLFRASPNLPLATHTAATAASAPLTLSDLPTLRVLVVDDNAVNRKVAVGLLERSGHQAFQAENGVEAIEALERQAVDLVLMDVQMPHMDGIDASQMIRAREEALGGHVPIVALTALGSPEDRARCRNAGMDGFLTKPLDQEELRRVVSEVLPLGKPSQPLPRVTSAAPSSKSETSSAHVDVDQLKVQVGGSMELLRELVDVFLEDVPRMMDSLEDSFVRSDSKGVVSSAHKLKGALLSLAAGPASEFAKAMEELGRSSQLDDAAPFLPQLKAELALVQTTLREVAQT